MHNEIKLYVLTNQPAALRSIAAAAGLGGMVMGTPAHPGNRTKWLPTSFHPGNGVPSGAPSPEQFYSRRLRLCIPRMPE